MTVSKQIKACNPNTARCCQQTEGVNQGQAGARSYQLLFQRGWSSRHQPKPKAGSTEETKNNNLLALDWLACKG